mgnify:CR=1 FL=1
MENIIKLWDRFEKSSAVEMNFSSKDYSFSLKKASAVESCSKNNSNMVLEMPLEESVKVQTAGPKPDKSNLNASDCIQVKAPLAGIFYRSPSPEEKPFVMIGDEVKAGQVLGIIEAMKMMNELTAPTDGIVEAVHGTDGQMMDYDAPLFSISKKAGEYV